MRRFDIPAAPPLKGGRGDLLRLVDPQGRAVAWLDPQMGRCLGYAVRPPDVTVGGWRELLGGVDREGRDGSRIAGGAIGIGWPWPTETPPDLLTRWQLIERDPTAATLACRCISHADCTRVAELTLGAWLDEGVLWLRLSARAPGANATLRPQFSLTLPGVTQAIEQRAVREGAAGTRVLCAAGAALRLTVATGSQRHTSWSRETTATGARWTVMAVPIGTGVADEESCHLILAVEPLD